MQTVNMSSKWCCVLAVVCLSVILLSLDADAQPTTDDITSCSASTLDEVVNMVKTIASNLQRNIEEIRDELTGVKNSVKTIASNQQLMKDELTGVKRQPADCGCDSAKSTTVNPIDYSTQSTHGTSCLVLIIIVKRPTEYHANEIWSLNQSINQSRFFL